MFIFNKRTAVSWEHYNGIVKVGFGGGTLVLNHTENTFILQIPNGKNYPKEAVIVNADLKIIDQTNANAEYTFLTTVELENKLIELGYPFINLGSATVSGVASFNGRTGVVTAQSGDYTTELLADFNSATRAQTEAELVAGTNITITPSGTGATRQLTIASTGGGGGATNLGYTPSATQGIVTSDTGTDATIQLADGTNAGLSENNFTDAEKTAITHSNRSVLDLIQEALTTALKTAYDSAVTWISTNGTNILNHLSSTSNPHSVTKTQIGLSNVDNTSDANKPVSTAQQTAIDLKSDKSLFLIQQSDRAALTANTSAQDLFDVNSGGVTLLENSTYRFVIDFSITGLSTTTGTVGLFFNGGTANITLLKCNTNTKKAGFSNASTPALVHIDVTTGVVITASNTTATSSGTISGLVVVTTGGTFKPQINMSVGATAVVKAGTHLIMDRLGSNTVTSG